MELPKHLHLTEKQLSRARILSNRNHILKYLPYNMVFCEVGVLAGDWTKAVLETDKISHFYALDTFDRPQTHKIFEDKDSSITHRMLYENRFKEHIAQNKMTILEGDSKETLKLLDNNSVDVFYLDSYHSYEQVNAELSIVKDKIKEDGLIIFNDYTFYDPYYKCELGVIAAANEFILENDYEVRFLALHNAGFYDLVISKIVVV